MEATRWAMVLKMSRTRPTVPASILRELTVLASCDPRTLRRYLRGEPVSPLPASRIESALRARGYGHLVVNRSGPPGRDNTGPSVV